MRFEFPMSSYEYESTFIRNPNRSKNSIAIEGKRLWVSKLAISNGVRLQKKQAPEEVEVVLDEDGYPILHKILKSGEVSKSTLSIKDNAGNGLNICEYKKQAENMYNQDADEIIDEINRRIQLLKDFKSSVMSQKVERID